MDDDLLKHYGRLGQKWGVRNPVGSNGLIVTSAQTTKSKYKIGAGAARILGGLVVRDAAASLAASPLIGAALAGAIPGGLAIAGVGAAGVGGYIVGHKIMGKIQNNMNKNKIEKALNLKMSDLNKTSRHEVERNARTYTNVKLSTKNKVLTINKTNTKGSRSGGSSKGSSKSQKDIENISLKRPNTKKPFIRWTEKERNDFDKDYNRKHKTLVSKFKSSKDPKQKARLMALSDKLETAYQDEIFYGDYD